MKKGVPSGKLKRSGVAALAAAKVGVKQVAHLSKRPFMSQEKRDIQSDEVDAANADIIFKALVHLRGTALKVAQMLSMEADLLPEKYRAELAKSYYQVPPLNRSLMRKVMMQELGDSPERVFDAFESEAFAAASLGQVHRAVSKAGDKLAVKVQYPGIGHTINSDIALVKKLTRPMKDHAEIAVVLEEIEARMLEETDYILEAENIDWFAKHLNLENVVIPKVYQQHSTKYVLTMEYLEGLHLYDWLQANPSQQEIDEAAQTIYDTFMRSLFEMNRFHADPNIGNYLFLGGAKVGLIDFGCVKFLDSAFSQQYSRLFHATVARDYDTLFDIYRDIGVLKVANNEISQPYYDEVLVPFFQWFSKPYKYKYFDFSKHQGFTSEGVKLGEAMRKHEGLKQGHIEVNKGFVYADRTLYGLYKIFEIMGAKVCMQNQWTCG